MNPPDDARQAALERLLARQEPLVPPAAMRSRTLAAVDAALAAPAVERARNDGLFTLSACIAMALTLALLVTTLVRQADHSSGAGPEGLSLANRAAALGITVETTAPAIVAASPAHRSPSGGHDGNLRAIDFPRVLRGDL